MSAKKPWYTSKRTWVGILLILAGAADYLASNGLIPKEFVPAVLSVSGAAIVALRKLST